MRRLALATLAVIWVAQFAVACGDADSGGRVLYREHTSVLVDSTIDGPTAGIGYGGTVAKVGTCLGFLNGTDEVTIIWPHETTIVSGSPFTLDVPSLGHVTVGDRLGGGGVERFVDNLPEGIDAIPRGCPTEQIFEFFPEG